MRNVVRAAFLAARAGRSVDFVIANPPANARFIVQCRKRGLREPDAELNLCLLNMRKSRLLRKLGSIRTQVPNQNSFRFASEIAARFLERRDQITFDQVLCDPTRLVEFDKIAEEIAPGFTPFEYRWACLSLRKKKQLGPEMLARVVQAEAIVNVPASKIVLSELPNNGGLYMLLSRKQALYIGECQNLRNRLGKHLDHSDNKGLAHWLWQSGISDLRIEYHVLPGTATSRVRKAMELELIRSRKPIFNVLGNLA